MFSSLSFSYSNFSLSTSISTGDPRYFLTYLIWINIYYSIALEGFSGSSYKPTNTLVS